MLDKRSGCIESSTFLEDAPNGPKAVVVVDDEAIISYRSAIGSFSITFAPPHGASHASLAAAKQIRGTENQ